jgi:predicted metal-binding membrane protein
LDSFRNVSVPVTGIVLASVLGVLALGAWAVSAESNMPMAGMFDLVSFGFFTALWAVGMVAMMFPSLIPMVYALTNSARRELEENGSSRGLGRILISVRAALFILGYVAIWTIVGVIFYLGISLLVQAGLPASFGTIRSWAGLILVGTGLYQFTRFKEMSLSKCRSPITFILTSWRNGSTGAGLMGANYGWFCTKCCWVLMVGLLTVGAMSLPLMGVFALIIFVEKVAPFGNLFSKIVGAAFLAAGFYLLL